MEKDNRIKQLTQHNEPLSNQNERLTQLLAMQTQQHAIIPQLLYLTAFVQPDEGFAVPKWRGG